MSKHTEKNYLMASLNLASVLAQKPLGLVFDIDGTLSPIVPTPEAAYLYPGVADMLEQLRQHAHVAIMTGRALRDGARIVNVDNVTYIGTHGLEWSDGLPTTHEVRIVPEAMRYVEPGQHLLTLVQQHLDSLPGVIVQRKTVGGTLHYRRAANHEQTRMQLLALLEEPTRQLGMRLGEGKMVVEVLAPLAINKGQAIRSYTERLGLRGLVFAGDDRTDLDAVLEAERLRQEGCTTLSIVVQYHDTLPELLAHADVIVDGVAGMAQHFDYISTYVGDKITIGGLLMCLNRNRRCSDRTVY
ncbi:MAG: trehalose-phosphatase [Ktedonobacteraceae bacterium]